MNDKKSVNKIWSSIEKILHFITYKISMSFR